MQSVGDFFLRRRVKDFTGAQKSHPRRPACIRRNAVRALTSEEKVVRRALCVSCHATSAVEGLRCYGNKIISTQIDVVTAAALVFLISLLLQLAHKFHVISLPSAPPRRAYCALIQPHSNYIMDAPANCLRSRRPQNLLQRYQPATRGPPILFVQAAPLARYCSACVRLQPWTTRLICFRTASVALGDGSDGVGIHDSYVNGQTAKNKERASFQFVLYLFITQLMPQLAFFQSGLFFPSAGAIVMLSINIF